MARKFVAASSQKVVFGSALVTASPLTLACWLNPVSAAVAYGVFAVNDNSTNEFGIRTDSSGHILAVSTDGTVSTATTSTAMSAGVWCHACAVISSASARAAFLNGGGKGTNATARTTSGVNQTEIGHTTGVGFTNGNIAECAIWNIALADAEVLALASGVAAWLIHPEALKFYTPLSMGFSPEINIMSNTNTGTVTGATVIDGPAITYGRRSRFH